MAIAALTARSRQETGKGAARSLRRQAMIPAVFYGPEVEPVPLALKATDVEKLLSGVSGERILIDLKIKNGEGAQIHRAMIREIQLHPVNEAILHLDLFAISMDKKITLEVPITLTGDAVGTTEGGIVQQARRTIEVSCLPGRIPEALELDVTNLLIGQSLHVSDLEVTEGVEVLAEEHLTIVSVVAPARAEEIEPEILEEGEEVEEEAVTETEGEGEAD